MDDALVPALDLGAPASFSLVYLGNILAQGYEIELLFGVRRRGLVVEVRGGLMQWQPQHRLLPFLPVALQLPDIREARLAVPPPYTGHVQLRLDWDGATVHGAGEIQLELAVWPNPIQLLRFSAPIGFAR